MHKSSSSPRIALLCMTFESFIPGARLLIPRSGPRLTAKTRLETNGMKFANIIRINLQRASSYGRKFRIECSENCVSSSLSSRHTDTLAGLETATAP